jgi:hypothetical protein
MEILRVPSSVIAYKATGLTPGAEYSYTVLTLADHSVLSETGTADSSGSLSIVLPSNIDGDYEITIDGETYDVSVVRPYVDPNTKGDTASEIQAYAENEEIARAIIDSIIAPGFYYKKYVLDTVGNGSDYIPLWVDAKKVLKVYENNVCIYDANDADNYPRSFKITEDKTAIVENYTDMVNRSEGANVILPLAASDNGSVIYFTGGFVKNADYKFVLEVGHKNVPSDIVRAASLLIDDLACGKLEYYKRFVTAYNTDQFRIQFDKSSFEGTGNIIVDKILSKYNKSILKLGVL